MADALEPPPTPGGMAQSSSALWRESLPCIRIKEVASTCTLPDSKNVKRVDGQIVKRAVWPKRLEKTNCELAQFKRYLSKITAVKDSTVKKYALGIRRFLGLIEVMVDGSWCDITSDQQGEDVNILGALAVDDFYGKILDLPILDFKYAWSCDMLESLLSFGKWHLHVCAGRIVNGPAGPWEQYSAAVKRLLGDLESGYRLIDPDWELCGMGVFGAAYKSFP